MPTATAQRMMVFLTEDDRYGHHAAAEELLQRAKSMGMAGATLWRAIEGFGATGHLRAARMPDLARGLPLVVEVIDSPEKIDAFVRVVEELCPDVLVTTEQVEITSGSHALT